MLAFWYQGAYDIGAQSNLAVRRRGGRATSALFRLRSDANRILCLFVGLDLLIYKLRPRRCLRFRKCPVDRKKRKGDVYSITRADGCNEMKPKKQDNFLK